jgi:hypothetical protein
VNITISKVPIRTIKLIVLREWIANSKKVEIMMVKTVVKTQPTDMKALVYRSLFQT